MSNLDTQQIAAAQTIVTTTELDCGTVSLGGRVVGAGEGLAITGSVNVTQGTSGTAVTVRVRKGEGIAGTVVGQALVSPLAAAAAGTIPFGVIDTAPADGATYSVTVQLTAAAANGTVNGGLVSLAKANTNE
jgi:hypothetical protein